MVKNKNLLHSIHHLLIGCLFVIKGIDKITHHAMIGGLILAFGIIVIIYFIYLLVTKKPNKTLSVIVHLLEAVVSLFTAYIFFKDGKVYLTYISLLASIGFFIGTYVSLRKLRQG